VAELSYRERVPGARLVRRRPGTPIERHYIQRFLADPRFPLVACARAEKAR
jgi:hypothetical protein